MKSLSLSRPLVIMLIGMPGAGKSFFARQFAETFSAPLVSFDFVRHTLAPQSEYSEDEDALVADIVRAQLSELVKTERSIIVDGGVNTVAGRQTVRMLANKYGYGTLLIWVQTDLPTAELRSLKRSKRRKGDELNAPMSSEVFEENAQLFEKPIRREDYVVISGKHTFATQVRVVLQKIVAPREGATVKAPPHKPVKPQSHAISQTHQASQRRNVRVS